MWSKSAKKTSLRKSNKNSPDPSTRQRGRTGQKKKTKEGTNRWCICLVQIYPVDSPFSISLIQPHENVRKRKKNQPGIFGQLLRMTSFLIYHRPDPFRPFCTASRIISRASSRLAALPRISIASPCAWFLGTLMRHPVFLRMALIWLPPWPTTKR